jgi:hypothetical protein
MENQDTKDLLQECNAGTKMATNSIEQMLEYAEDAEFRRILLDYNGQHARLGERCHKLLDKYNLQERDPSMMASAMSHISTSMKMMVNGDVQEMAKIMMDGCNMGIQSLGKYLNQYEQADEECKKVARDLIDSEFAFMKKLIAYL